MSTDNFDAALRQHFQDAPEPDDAGFSLRVMAALPAQPTPRRRQGAQWLRRAQWFAISAAACGLATLLSGNNGRLDLQHAIAAVALLGLMMFWSIPSRWSRW